MLILILEQNRSRREETQRKRERERHARKKETHKRKKGGSLVIFELLKSSAVISHRSLFARKGEELTASFLFLFSLLLLFLPSSFPLLLLKPLLVPGSVPDHHRLHVLARVTRQLRQSAYERMADVREGGQAVSAVEKSLLHNGLGKGHGEGGASLLVDVADEVVRGDDVAENFGGGRGGEVGSFGVLEVEGLGEVGDEGFRGCVATEHRCGRQTGA